MSHLFAPVCHPPGDSDSESVTIVFWLHLPTQRYIGCHGFTKSLQTQMTQTHIPSFTDFFLMKTQEWKDCCAYRNIGIRGSNAKYETGMKELNTFRYKHNDKTCFLTPLHRKTTTRLLFFFKHLWIETQEQVSTGPVKAMTARTITISTVTVSTVPP